jgi:hypothetical protein
MVIPVMVALKEAALKANKLSVKIALKELDNPPV